MCNILYFNKLLPHLVLMIVLFIKIVFKKILSNVIVIIFILIECEYCVLCIKTVLLPRGSHALAVGIGFYGAAKSRYGESTLNLYISHKVS